MDLLTIITMLALIEYFYFGYKVGGARGKYGIKAPAMTGNDIFERVNRVHGNTQEQLIIFIPSLWAFGHYISPIYASGLGLIFLVGRIVYSIAYIKKTIHFFKLLKISGFEAKGWFREMVTLYDFFLII